MQNKTKKKKLLMELDSLRSSSRRRVFDVCSRLLFFSPARWCENDIETKDVRTPFLVKMRYLFEEAFEVRLNQHFCGRRQ